MFVSNKRIYDWIRFVIGLALLLLLALVLSKGYTPPGPMGEVLRHNMRFDIDANPLFYSEVDSSKHYDYDELFSPLEE